MNKTASQGFSQAKYLSQLKYMAGNRSAKPQNRSTGGVVKEEQGKMCNFAPTRKTAYFGGGGCQVPPTIFH